MFCANIHGYVRLYADIFCANMRGYILCESTWICANIHGYVRLYTDICEYTRICFVRLSADIFFVQTYTDVFCAYAQTFCANIHKYFANVQTDGGAEHTESESSGGDRDGKLGLVFYISPSKDYLCCAYLDTRNHVYITIQPA